MREGGQNKTERNALIRKQEMLKIKELSFQIKYSGPQNIPKASRKNKIRKTRSIKRVSGRMTIELSDTRGSIHTPKE